MGMKHNLLLAGLALLIIMVGVQLWHAWPAHSGHGGMGAMLGGVQCGDKVCPPGQSCFQDKYGYKDPYCY